MIETLGLVLDVSFFVALVRIATPLLFATIGELYCERSGVLNLGIEGIMLFGAMVGFSAAYFSGSLWVGVLAAVFSGVLAGLLMSLLTVALGVSQHVSGIGLTLLATGLSFYFYRLVFGQPASPPNIVPFQPVSIPYLSDIPLVGPVLFNQTALTYLALLVVPATAYVLFRTAWGLDLRTVGENPRAADAAGVSVWWMRTQALVIGSALMAVGGAYLTISQFQRVHLRGYFRARLGRHRARRVRAVEPLALRRRRAALRGAGGAATPPAGDQRAPASLSGVLMLPFVMTIVAMALVSRNARAPAALLVPFRKEER
jgi:simple sugar transport system permease protein